MLGALSGGVPDGGDHEFQVLVVEGHRAAGVYLTRPPGHRNETWEMDHKQLPILVMPPRGAACCPWLTTVIDDATRVLVGWAIALTPHTGTVLTAVRMALVHDPARGPFG